MSLDRIVLIISCLLLGLGGASTAQANSKVYFLTGGGGQLQIGGGLPLPIQATNPAATGTVFPSLLIPPKAGAQVVGTTTMTVQQKLQIPAAVFSKPAAQLTLGQFAQNPNLYAVATNLRYTWPTAAATLSTLARTGAKTTTVATALGSTVRYSNPLASKFGGPAVFALSPGAPSGFMPSVAVTLFGIVVKGPGNPPCIHTALTPVPFPNPPFVGNPACVAALGQAVATGVAAAGGLFNNAVTTPGGTALALLSTAPGAMTVPTGATTWPGALKNGPGPKPGVGIGAFGPGPLKPGGAAGTVSVFAFTPGTAVNGVNNRGFTNMASSRGFPWTTGMITLIATDAAGAPETFTITGQDNRTANGAGTIQLVSGGVSQRTRTGPNANRGWIRLVLAPLPGVPALSTPALAVTAGLMLLVAGYTMRRRLFS